MSIQHQPSEAEWLLRSLSKVGPNKPVGYLPLYTLTDVAQLAPESIAADAIARGLAAVQFGPEECCIQSGALYIYDRIALSTLLRSHADTLAAEGMPSDPDRFVAHIAATWLEPNHPAYPVIAAAFGDVA
jgi:hypothetical protein